MLDSLAQCVDSHFPLSVERRLVLAQDLESLWYLRSDMLSIISQSHGEAVARGVMEPITAMFEGYLPSGLFSRPMPLEQ